MVKKWATESDKVRACNLRKKINPTTNKNYTDEEIQFMFYHKAKEQLSQPDKQSQNKDKDDIDTNAELSDELKTIAKTMNVLGKLNCNVQFKDLVAYMRDTKNLQKYIPKYKRPAFLNDKQRYIIDTILSSKKKIIMVEGDQRTGKSTCIWIAILEYVLSRDPEYTQIDLMAGKGEQCERILYDVCNDILLTDVNNELIRNSVASKAMFFNGSRINAHETTVADIKGADGHLIWIDELDVAVQAEPEAVLSAMFVLRARKNIKIVLSANMGKGAYILLRQVLNKPEYKDDVAFLTLTKADCPHLLSLNNDPILEDVSNAIAGEDFTRRRLHNETTGEGDQFDPITLNEAVEAYPFWMSQGVLAEHVILSIDPSQTGHKVGWILGAVGKGVAWEIDSGEIQLGQYDATHEKMTPEAFDMKMINMMKAHGAKFTIESNSGGLLMKQKFERYGLSGWTHNFGGDDKVDSHGALIRNLRDFIDKHIFVFKSLDLKSQLMIYNPKISKEEKFKGNLADASLHLMWKIAWLMNGKSAISFIDIKGE